MRDVQAFSSRIRQAGVAALPAHARVCVCVCVFGLLLCLHYTTKDHTCCVYSGWLSILRVTVFIAGDQHSRNCFRHQETLL